MTEAGAVLGTSGGMELTPHTSGRREGGNAVVEQVGDGLRATFEEIDSTGGQLGIFPQAFTHLSLINSSVTLNRERDWRAARLKAPALAIAQ